MKKHLRLGAVAVASAGLVFFSTVHAAAINIPMHVRA